MKLLGYIRVSTTEQRQEGCSLTMQGEKLRAYCQLHEIDLVDIIEESLSAKAVDSRPGFMSALEQVYSGKADGLLIWKLDRAFRSTQDALAVAQRLNKKGRALVSVSEQLDTRSAMGSFVFTLMASLAELERRLIGERTSAALQSKKSRGNVSEQSPSVTTWPLTVSTWSPTLTSNTLSAYGGNHLSKAIATEQLPGI